MRRNCTFKLRHNIGKNEELLELKNETMSKYLGIVIWMEKAKQDIQEKCPLLADGNHLSTPTEPKLENELAYTLLYYFFMF